MYGFVRGEISPFRLVRMTQKDMQAIKAPETTEKKPLGVNVIKVKTLMTAKAGGVFKLVRSSCCGVQGKDAAPAAPPVAKVTSVLPKPEAVKVDLPSLNPIRPNRSTVCTLQLVFPLVNSKKHLVHLLKCCLRCWSGTEEKSSSSSCQDQNNPAHPEQRCARYTHLYA